MDFRQKYTGRSIVARNARALITCETGDSARRGRVCIWPPINKMASIYKRGNVWYSRIMINGKMIRKPLSSNAKVAEEKLGELIKVRNHSEFGEPIKHIGWGAFREKYLEYSSGKKAQNTFKQDLAAIRSLESQFAIFKLAEITPEMLETWQARRKNDCIQVSTLNRELGAIKAMLRRAEMWKYIEAQPWSRIKKFKETPKRLSFYSDDEVERIRGVLRHPWQTTVLLLGAKAGLRRSEIYWLQWRDVDLEKRIISVTPKDGWNPKDYEQRHVPISETLHAHLMGIAGKPNKPNKPDEWVLNPRPSSENVVTHIMRRLIKRAGLQGSTHTLRHTFASHLVQRGQSLYVVSRLLGHSDTKMTQRYAHLAPSNLSSAIEVLS